MIANKKYDIETLLSAGKNLNILLDARISDVPEQFKTNKSLMLIIGHNLFTPMQNFNINEEFLIVDLSFNRKVHTCQIPLKAIYQVQIENTNYGLIYEDDVPKDHPVLVKEKRESFKVITNDKIQESAVKNKPKLRLVK